MTTMDKHIKNIKREQKLAELCVCGGVLICESVSQI
jgi:hypothetical protein